MGGLLQDQLQSSSVLPRWGEKIERLSLILCWRIFEGPLLMIMMLRPITESQTGGFALLPLPFLHWWYKRARSAEAERGQTDLIGWIHVNLSPQIYYFYKKELDWCNSGACVYACACSSCFFHHIRSSWTPLSSLKDTPPSSAHLRPSTPPCLSSLPNTHTYTSTSAWHTLVVCDRRRCWRWLLTFWTVKGLRWGCVEVCASEGGMEDSCISPIVLSGGDNSHKQNLLTPQWLLLLLLNWLLLDCLPKLDDYGNRMFSR